MKLVAIDGTADFDDVYLRAGAKMEPARLVTPDEYVALHEGTTYEEIVRRFGQPLRTNKQRTLVTYRYDPEVADARPLCSYLELTFDRQGRLIKKRLFAE